MTKFEELMDIITRNKNKSTKKTIAIAEDKQEEDDIELEVSGTESTIAPLVAEADDQLDPDLIDMLYRSNRNRVPMGEGSL